MMDWIGMKKQLEEAARIRFIESIIHASVPGIILGALSALLMLSIKIGYSGSGVASLSDGSFLAAAMVGVLVWVSVVLYALFKSD